MCAWLKSKRPSKKKQYTHLPTNKRAGMNVNKSITTRIIKQGVWRHQPQRRGTCRPWLLSVLSRTPDTLSARYACIHRIYNSVAKKSSIYEGALDRIPRTHYTWATSVITRQRTEPNAKKKEQAYKQINKQTTTHCISHRPTSSASDMQSCFVQHLVPWVDGSTGRLNYKFHFNVYNGLFALHYGRDIYIYREREQNVNMRTTNCCVS